MANLGSLQLVIQKEMGGDSDCINVRIRGSRLVLYCGPGNRPSCHGLRHSQQYRSHIDDIRIRLRKRYAVSSGGKYFAGVDPTPQVFGPLVLAPLSEVTILPMFATNNRHPTGVSFSHPFFSFTEGEFMWMSLDRNAFS